MVSETGEVGRLDGRNERLHVASSLGLLAGHAPRSLPLPLITPLPPVAPSVPPPDEAMKGLIESTPLADIKAADFDAFFLAGGHGTVGDFPNDANLIALLEAAAVRP